MLTYLDMLVLPLSSFPDQVQLLHESVHKVRSGPPHHPVYRLEKFLDPFLKKRLSGRVTDPQDIHIVHALTVHQRSVMHPQLHHWSLGANREGQRFLALMWPWRRSLGELGELVL